MEKDKLELSSEELGAINSDLAVRIQNGERELLPVLWASIERLAAWHANRLLCRLPYWTIEFDELIDSAYIALADAVYTYDSTRAAFSTHYAMRLKTAFSEALGGRSLRQRNDPLRYALRFEAPIGEYSA